MTEPLTKGQPIALRVMSYNVHMQKDDLDALASVVRAVEPDVVMVQEAPRHCRWRAKCADLARRLGLVVAVGGLPSLGNLLLTNLRVRVHDSWCVRLPFTPGLHMRGAAFAVCSVAKTRFTIAGSHLSIDDVERPGQAAVLKKHLDEVAHPLILGADLNDDPGHPSWEILVKGLVDVAERCGQADRLTFPSGRADRRIDALFVDPRISVKRYDVIDTPESRRASDHYPIVADVELPPA